MAPAAMSDVNLCASKVHSAAAARARRLLLEAYSAQSTSSVTPAQVAPRMQIHS